MPGDSLVWGADESCARDGCQLRKALSDAQRMLAEARQIVTSGMRGNMSQALWCDAGGHAFSERDPDRQRISISTLDEESGREVMESRDFCGEHARAAGLLNRKTRPASAAITNGDV